RQFRPVLARVVRHVDAAAGTAAELAPRVHRDLPLTREERVGIVRVHREARAAGVLVHEEDALPRRAAVGRLEDAALLLRRGDASDRARINDVGVGRVDDDAADAARLLEPGVLPRHAGVGGLVDAVAHDVAVADDPGFAGPGPHLVVVGGGD